MALRGGGLTQGPRSALALEASVPLAASEKRAGCRLAGTLPQM